MPKNRKSSAHNYKMQAKNEVLINYRQEHIKAYNRNQKFTRHILLYSLLSMIYFPNDPKKSDTYLFNRKHLKSPSGDQSVKRLQLCNKSIII